MLYKIHNFGYQVVWTVKGRSTKHCSHVELALFQRFATLFMVLMTKIQNQSAAGNVIQQIKMTLV